jgi:hypothetical protein
VRILFDQGTPAPLRHLLSDHDVSTAYELGWSTLKNGDLLTAAEAQHFEVLVTTDASLKYQQNLAARSIAIVVLSTTSWPRIKLAAEAIGSAIVASERGSYSEVSVP